MNNQSPYRDVRSLARGLALLEALAKLGWAKPSDLSAATGIERSSVYRIVNTLVELGFVIHRKDDGAFALTHRIRRIADGIRHDEVILQKIRPLLEDLVAEIKWPSDLAILSGGSVTIQESTHSLSPITFHRRMIGQDRPLLDSSLGRAILAVLSPAEREMALDIARAGGTLGESADHSAKSIERMVRQVREKGYAWSEGTVDPDTSAMAVGFRGEPGIIGSVNIVFFKKTISEAAAVERYLPALQECVDRITACL